MEVARLLGVRRLWKWDHTGSLPQDRDSLKTQAPDSRQIDGKKSY